jgi:hypothetical protein
MCSFAIFVAFYASGHLAMFLENWHSSVMASSAVFGVSFVGLVGGGAKIWYDIFS